MKWIKPIVLIPICEGQNNVCPVGIQCSFEDEENVAYFRMTL